MLVSSRKLVLATGAVCRVLWRRRSWQDGGPVFRRLLTLRTPQFQGEAWAAVPGEAQSPAHPALREGESERRASWGRWPLRRLGRRRRAARRKE